jgi:hypothetical protein
MDALFLGIHYVVSCGVLWFFDGVQLKLLIARLIELIKKEYNIK